MTQKTIIRHAIESLYGPCPEGDFVRANDWAHGIDWEKVQIAVEDEHPNFEWTHAHPKDLKVAEAMIFDVRHEMLHQAGHGTES